MGSMMALVLSFPSSRLFGYSPSPSFGVGRSTSSSTPIFRYHPSESRKAALYATNHREYRSGSLHPEKLEIFNSLEGWMEEDILTLLKPVENSWQPQDLLPDFSSESFFEEIKDIQERAAKIPAEYYVCLVGNMLAEESLPMFQSFLNSHDGIRDDTGASTTSWARWTRRWSAEENRHGDILNKYLYLSGRLDMRQIEKTRQYLLGSGMILGTENNPYCCFVYTSFQERAAFISHGNTARHAKEWGDKMLAKICGLIAADEKRHETAYTKIVEKLFEIDPDTSMLAFADMMKKKITMPGFLMFDGKDHDLFGHYSSVAQKIGIYTTKDYADIVEFFVERWNVENLIGLSSEGKQARDYVCGLPQRFRKMAARFRKTGQYSSLVPFSWIFDEQVLV